MGERRRPRRWKVVPVVIVCLLGLGATVWFVWLPTYRPELEEGERFGIDVSHHQGSIDWKLVADDDIAFAYIKATQRDDFVDPRFEENWHAATDAGLQRGAYHFFSLCASGEAQARHFISVVPDDADALPPAVDLELLGTCDRRPDAATVARELADFLRIVESSTGTSVVLYVGDDFEERYPVHEQLDRPTWVLRFLRRPEGEWWLWQVGGYANVDGIDGRVDLDVMAASP